MSLIDHTRWYDTLINQLHDNTIVINPPCRELRNADTRVDLVTREAVGRGEELRAVSAREGSAKGRRQDDALLHAEISYPMAI